MPVYVCHCMGVKDEAVSTAVANGARTIEDLQRACGAGSDCGGCHAALAELLAGDAHQLVSATGTA
jgi:bacterioferritin-associated ferredoxin